MNEKNSGRRALRLPGGFWAVVALVVWALGVTALLDRTPYGLDEATARAVLFLWSISDQVASPIVTMGIPDFRAVYLIPAGVFFSGSLLAAKLCALLVVVATAIGLYHWRLRQGDAETPLLASGLLLLSPLTVSSIDRVAIGPFLLLTFLLGSWADDSYRASRIRFGGFYFSQLLLSVAAVSLHPAGLAYPIVLAISWLRDRPAEPDAPAMIPGREHTHVLLGIGIATLLGALLAAGWPHQGWFANPVTALAQDVLAFPAESALASTLLFWVLGAVLALALLATLWRMRSQILADRFAATLVLAGAIAACTGDASFSLLAFVLLLYWGFPLLLRVHVGKTAGLVGQRGVALALLIVVSTLFLSADRGRYAQLAQGLELSAQDQLIRVLAESVQQSHPVTPQPGLVTEQEKAKSGPRVASQWPGRTMIACRCSTLPLPPAAEDQQVFAANLRGLDYVVFDPQNPANRGLSRGFALLGGAQAETVSLQPGGVVLRLHPAEAPRPAPGLQG
ncbi:conserved membrane hypothetical protein [Burkholderiales bacterium]|nr:conserved membrane hypothetical protein [Burkholderiales bacterium]